MISFDTLQKLQFSPLTFEFRSKNSLVHVICPVAPSYGFSRITEPRRILKKRKHQVIKSQYVIKVYFLENRVSNIKSDSIIISSIAEPSKTTYSVVQNDVRFTSKGILKPMSQNKMQVTIYLSE